MANIAFLFAGQGAQYPGMGRELYGCSPAAREVFDAADTRRPGTLRQCFEGSAEELTVTANTQPCLWCVDLAAAAALGEAGIVPAAVAGFSLGEVAAVTFAGGFTPREGFDFVCLRGEVMQRAAEERPGRMAAVLKLEEAQVEQICAELGQLWPVNYNCPGQITVAGEAQRMEVLLTAVKEAGGRVVPLAVGGGFHSPLMDTAGAALAVRLGGRTARWSLPVYANLTAGVYPAQFGATLAAQVNHPVRWRATLERMADAGIDTFIEVGPGKTLSGFVKKTLPAAAVYQVQDETTLKETLQALCREDQIC